MLLQHLDGIPFRKLADEMDLSVGKVYTKCFKVAGNLPHCADITRKYCTRYCGILVVDGKFISVKGYMKKIPFLYGIDYLTHDIPTYTMAVSESYRSWFRYFNSLRLLNYPLTAIVCDDNENIAKACLGVYPQAIIQLCQNHFKENIRRSLDLQNDEIHRQFMDEIEDLFRGKRSEDDFNRVGKRIYQKYADNQLFVAILLQINARKSVLLGYLKGHGIPCTTNLIESFNSHFEGRFKSVKEYQSFHHAQIWINAMIVRRRFKEFTDCEGKFRHLNGKKSFEKSRRPDVDLSTFSDILRDRF